MSDEELAAELMPDDPSAALRYIRTMTAARRQVYKDMIYVAAELNAGSVPDGVIVKWDKKCRSVPPHTKEDGS